jgi:hypothetical protein
MLADYIVTLEQTIGNMVAVVTGIRAESEQDAIQVARDHMATPHHWKPVAVREIL